MTISGNYRTQQEEVKIVKRWIADNGYRDQWFGIRGVNNKDAGDVYVRWQDKTYTLFEVKQESIARFTKYNEYGIDLVSSIVYNGRPFDKGRKDARLLYSFLNALNPMHPGFKWGKLMCSYADAWLFYAKHDDGSVAFINVYDYRRMRSDMVSFLKRVMDAECQFAINNKSPEQMSCKDRFQSAVLFVPYQLLEPYKVLQLNEIKHGRNVLGALYNAARYVRGKEI